MILTGTEKIITHDLSVLVGIKRIVTGTEKIIHNLKKIILGY